MALLNSESSSDVTDSTVSEKNDNQKDEPKCPTDLKSHVQKMENVVKSLENTLVDGHQTEHQVIMTLQNDNIKNQKLSSQLEEARKENKQLLNVIQQRCGDIESSRSTSRSHVDLTSLSSVSMVHLQYKYEELLESHQGLLKVLESRVKEVQNCYKENENLRKDLHNLGLEVSEYELNLRKLCDKYFALRKRKNEKDERETLRVVHDRLVRTIHHQHMERDAFLRDVLQNSEDSDRALLLQEVRRGNMLQHENTMLRQENLYLRSKFCKAKRNSKANS